MNKTNDEFEDFKILTMDELENVGFIMKTLYGEIDDTKERIRGFYSSFGNRQPQLGDFVYSDNGTKLEILNTPKDQFSYIFKSHGVQDW